MPMRDQVNLKRWIILVFLLMISMTFLFLQLLSLKAIDSTVSTFFNLNINVNSCDKKGQLSYVRRSNCVTSKCWQFWSQRAVSPHSIFKFHPQLLSRFQALESLQGLLSNRGRKNDVLVCWHMSLSTLTSPFSSSILLSIHFLTCWQGEFV